MTYEQAIQKIGDLPKEREFIKDVIIRPFVVPKLDLDFSRYKGFIYTTGVDLENLQNDKAQLFSSNNQYEVCWLGYADDATLLFEIEK